MGSISFHETGVVKNAEGAWLHVPTRFVYVSEKPYEITMIFQSADGDVPWVFSRDLVDMCFKSTDIVGGGDIFWSKTTAYSVAVHLRDADTGELQSIGYARAPLERFVKATYEMVPPGHESIEVPGIDVFMEWNASHGW